MSRRRLPTTRTVDPLAESVAQVVQVRSARRTRSRQAGDATVAGLAQRLDDKGCASGRVTAARVEELSRAFDRLEAKLNALLLAASATFLSTLLGLIVYALRTRGVLP